MKKTNMLLVLFIWCGVATAKQNRPNIVWLTTEDNSAQWYRLYNPNGAAMPNIERLAKDGLVYNHAFSCGAVCSAARSTIISGCYPPRMGAQYHRAQSPVADLPPNLKMFPAYLREAGYYTANNYKQDYNFGPEHKEGVWNDSSKTATYRNRKDGQPFFYVQNFHTTHESRMHPGPKYGYDQETKTPEASVELFPYHPDTPTFRHAYARYLDLNAQIDAEIGEVIDQLEADGLLDDTFIFHYGDHGGVLPGSKGYACNDGMQVAMVVYVPKNWQQLAPATRGSRIDGFVEFTDLSATVLNLAGIPIPDEIDGKPFLGKGVQLDELNRRDTAYGFAERFDEKYDMVRTLRKGRFQYVRNYQPFNFDGLYNEYRYHQPAYQEWRKLFEKGDLNPEQAAFFKPRTPEQLFDLEKDPHQTRNLADNPAYADTLIEMRGLLQRREKEMPDLGFYPEPVLIDECRNINTVEFGRQRAEQIQRLIAIADLQLEPFPEARVQLGKTLLSKEPMERYWGLITCSAFGHQAAPFYDQAEELATSDPDRLVRVRAAEFLALTKQGDPRPVLVKALNETKDKIEANLILNTAVLLRDGEQHWDFDIDDIRNASWFSIKTGEFQSRINYLKQ